MEQETVNELKNIYHPLFEHCLEGHVHLSNYKNIKRFLEFPYSAKFPRYFHSLIMDPEEVEVVVYHFPCPDGFAAAMIAYAFNPNIQFFGVNHDQIEYMQHKLENKNVLFLDIAPKLSVLEKFGHLMRKYVILDHHISAMNECLNIHVSNKVFDMDHSGCMLSWFYFSKQSSYVPYLLKAVEARDLWKKNEEFDEFLAGLHGGFGYCAECWTNPETEKKSREFGFILEKKRKISISTYLRNISERYIGSQRFWLINCTDKSCISDIGCEIVSKENNHQDIAMMFTYDTRHKEYHVSLRSLNPDGPDVSLMAQKLGNGGGHKHAAGFIYRGKTIEDLFL
jgi:uncharacterized protein